MLCKTLVHFEPLATTARSAQQPQEGAGAHIANYFRVKRGKIMPPLVRCAPPSGSACCPPPPRSLGKHRRRRGSGGDGALPPSFAALTPPPLALPAGSFPFGNWDCVPNPRIAIGCSLRSQPLALRPPPAPLRFASLA